MTAMAGAIFGPKNLAGDKRHALAPVTLPVPVIRQLFNSIYTVEVTDTAAGSF